jgi:hypothetical protein
MQEQGIKHRNKWECAELREIENNYNLLINKGYGAGSFYELIAQ